MSARDKVAWGTILTALALAGGVSLFIARSTAQAEVTPIREDVSALKADRGSDRARLDRIEGKVDKILDRLPPRPSP